MILKASGSKGVPQGGVISPLLSNLYLNEVDKMLERAKETTRNGRYTYIEYVRYADDLVILVDAYPRPDWLLRAADKRLREELAKLHVAINEEKSRVVDLGKGGSFAFLGFEFRRIRSHNRSHNPWREAGRRAAYGKSVRAVRSGGGRRRAHRVPRQPSTLQLIWKDRLSRGLFTGPTPDDVSLIH
jgi:hypothetical protein